MQLSVALRIRHVHVHVRAVSPDLRALTGAGSSCLTLSHVIEHTLHGLAVWEGTRSIFTARLLISLPPLALVSME